MIRNLQNFGENRSTDMKLELICTSSTSRDKPKISLFFTNTAKKKSGKVNNRKFSKPINKT